MTSRSAEQVPEATQLAPPPDRLVALWEIVSVSFSCLLAEWVVMAFVGRSKLIGGIPVLLAFALMIFSHRVRRESWYSLGFRIDNLLSCSRLLLPPTVIAIVAILLGAWWFNPEGLVLRPLRAHFLTLPPWALLQQYALQGFINQRAQLVFGKGWKSILLVATVFALLHMPNPTLVSLTLIGGVLWAAIYQREPNLYLLALSHAAASFALALSVPPNMIHNLRVGLKYFG
jgi:Type II CAAX prenyl endopeptidase Rce1-like